MESDDMSCKRIEGVQPLRLAPPGGHYAHVVRVADFVFVSGQLPITPSGEKLADAGFDVQARQVLDNVEAALLAAGATRDRLVQVRVYLADVADWPRFDTLYADWIGAHRPARAVVPVPALHYGLRLEVEALALC
jgi:reactive intermediate/imine deaminase